MRVVCTRRGAGRCAAWGVGEGGGWRGDAQKSGAGVGEGAGGRGLVCFLEEVLWGGGGSVLRGAVLGSVAGEREGEEVMLGECATLTDNFSLSIGARQVVSANPSLRYTVHVAVTLGRHVTTLR